MELWQVAFFVIVAAGLLWAKPLVGIVFFAIGGIILWGLKIIKSHMP